MKKFKVIEEKNAFTNEVSHYELWWHKPTFWNKNRWLPQQEWNARGFNMTKKFQFKTDVLDYIKKNHIPKTRTEILEGVVDGNFGIQRSDRVGQFRICGA